MRRVAFLALFAAVFAFGDAKLNANITAVQLDEGGFFVGTDAGEVLRYDIGAKKIDENFAIKLPSAKNYLDGSINARIHALDIHKGVFVIASEGDFGTQNVSVCRNSGRSSGSNSSGGVNSIAKNASGVNLNNATCTTIKSPFTNIKKVFFLDEKTAIFALLSADIRLVDLSEFFNGAKNPKLITKKEFKFSITSLNDIALSADKSRLLAGTESGELQIFGIKEWKVLANYDKINKDTIDQVDYKGGIIVSCSKERKLGLVIKGEQKFEQKPYLIYSCALSPSGQIAAYSMLQADNYNSTTTLVQTRDFKALKNFDNGRFFAKFIVFTSENEFIVAGDKAIITRGVK